VLRLCVFGVFANRSFFSREVRFCEAAKKCYLHLNDLEGTLHFRKSNEVKILHDIGILLRKIPIFESEFLCFEYGQKEYDPL